MTKVVLDGVGGDHAPAEAVAGVKLALDRGFVRPDDLLLTGPRETLRAALVAGGLDADSIAIEDAPDLLTSADSPIDAAKKKPRNSIAVGVQLVKEGRAGSFISAGSTGTVVAAAQLGLRRLEGIRKPAIAAIIHGEKNPFLVLDVGANAQVKAHDLAQFALMGAAYYAGTFGGGSSGIERPRVGILNIGSEELKGNPLVKEARALIKQLPIEFHGNIEGVEIFAGECHVVVTDGFTGNVALKTLEGGLKVLFNALLEAFGSKPEYKEPADALLPALLPLHAQMSPDTYGGAVLLGVDGICIISHGSSGSTAMLNAITLGHEMAQRGLVAEIAAAFAAD